MPIRSLHSIWLLMAAAAILISAPVLAAMTGEVIAVSSGDLITILNTNNKERVIKLAEIEAPEPGQAYFEEARQALAERVLGKHITAERTAWDQQGRFVGKITLQSEYINAWLVANGHAWVYHRYSDDPQLAQMEIDAKNLKLGLWALPKEQQVAPWEWRNQQE